MSKKNKKKQDKNGNGATTQRNAKPTVTEESRVHVIHDCMCAAHEAARREFTALLIDIKAEINWKDEIHPGVDATCVQALFQRHIDGYAESIQHGGAKARVVDALILEIFVDPLTAVNKRLARIAEPLPVQAIENILMPPRPRR